MCSLSQIFNRYLYVLRAKIIDFLCWKLINPKKEVKLLKMFYICWFFNRLCAWHQVLTPHNSLHEVISSSFPVITSLWFDNCLIWFVCNGDGLDSTPSINALNLCMYLSCYISFIIRMNFPPKLNKHFHFLTINGIDIDPYL